MSAIDPNFGLWRSALQYWIEPLPEAQTMSDGQEQPPSLNNPYFSTGGGCGIHMAMDIRKHAIDARGTCPLCATVAYGHATAIREFSIWCALQNDRRDLLAHTANNRDFFVRCWGFEELAGASGYLRRCESCEKTPLFPWATDLEPERIAAFLESDSRFRDSFPMALLRETLPTNSAAYCIQPAVSNVWGELHNPSPYKFPVMSAYEHGQTAHVPVYDEAKFMEAVRTGDFSAYGIARPSFAPQLADAPIDNHPDITEECDMCGKPAVTAFGDQEFCARHADEYVRENKLNEYSMPNGRDYDALRRDLVGELPKLDDGRGFKLL